jgi:hypothetical protein
MLAHAGGDTHQEAQFWPFIMHAAVQRHNNLYSYGNQPPAIRIIKAGGASATTQLRKFKVLLCDCRVAIKDVEIYDKISPLRILAIHLGYDTRRDSGYFVYIPELQRITTVSDIDFVEHSFTCLGTIRPNVRLLKRSHNIFLPEPPPPPPSRAPLLPIPPAATAPAASPAASAPRPAPAPLPSAADLAAGLCALHHAPAAAAQLVTVASTAAADVVFLAGSSVGETYAVETAPGPIPILRTFHEAVADPIYGDKWRAACDDDIRGKYTELKTWELVKAFPLPARPQGDQGQMGLSRQVQVRWLCRQVQGPLRRLWLQPSTRRRLHGYLLQHPAP